MSVLTRYPVPQPSVAAVKEEGARLYFRLEPTIVQDPVLQFLRPLRGLESIEAGIVDDPRLYFRLEVVPPPVLEFLRPLRGLESVEAGIVDDSRFYFRLEPTIVPEPVLDFLQPLRSLELVKTGVVHDPRLYFHLELLVVADTDSFAYIPILRRRRR